MDPHPVAAGTGAAQRDDPGGRIGTAVGARSGLVGNPSDLFGGKVISLLFYAFSAGVTLYESARVTVVPNARDTTSFPDVAALACSRHQYGYYGGIRLIEALLSASTIAARPAASTGRGATSP